MNHRQQTLDPFNPDTWDGEEMRYFMLIDAARTDRRDQRISNGRVEHAAYIIRAFLLHAEQEIRLFSGALSRVYNGMSVYENPYILKAVETFLTRSGSRLVIATENALDVDLGMSAEIHPVVRVVREMENTGRLQGCFEISRATEEGLAFLERKNFRNHWMTMDDNAYRIETDHKQAGAHANFNNPETTGALKTLFDFLQGTEPVVRIGA